MILKIKSLKFLAGRPVAIIHENIALKLNVGVGERINIKKRRGVQEITCVLDTAAGMLRENEIVVSSEIIKNLKLREKDDVEIEPAIKPLSVNFILKKLNGEKLSYSEIFSIIRDVVNNKLTETEIAYFVSAMYFHEMSKDETINLITAMVKNGKILEINKKRIFDKHSIGGVAGNRTTPIIISICAAAGLTMPKTSSRAITSAAGTADVIETICKVEHSTKDIQKIVKKINACFVWGGSLGLAPADDKIIQVERILSLDPEAQLIASILAKKISVGATDFLLDIPYGKGAKVTEKKAKKLAKKFHEICEILGIRIKIVLTNGEQPIGKGIGPILEMRDVLAILVRNKLRPLDLEMKSIVLAGMLLELAGKTKEGHGKRLASYILNSGQAFEKFKEIVKAQGGNLGNIEEKLKFGKFKKNIRAEKHGKILEINNKKINFVARIAGCPTYKSAGLQLHKKLGDFVKKQDILVTIYSENKKKLKYAINVFNKSNTIIIK